MKAAELRRTARGVALLLAVACLLLGFLQAGSWTILPGLLIPPIAWIWLRRQPAFASASTSLLGMTLLAGIGMLTGLPRYLMLAAGVSALGAWDLMLFEADMAGVPEDASSAALTRDHVRRLALTLVPALLLTFAASILELSLPFAVILALVLTAGGGVMLAIRSPAAAPR